MRLIKQGFFFDYKLFLNIMVALGIGVLTIYSVSYSVAGFNNFKRQILFIALGLLIFFFASRVNYGAWENYARVIYFLGLASLILVLFLGKETHGTLGWLEYASFHIQPVEVMKVGALLVLAKYFSKIRADDKRFRHIVISAVYCAIPAVLILFQPDLGSASVIMGIWFIVILIWGIKKRHLITLFGIFSFLALSSWFIFLKPYQKARLTSFINPESDPSNSGYNVLQSITAIGSGRVYGKGLGYGSQSQLHFLPEAHTDFVFAVVGEELGFLGISILVVSFLFLFNGIYKIAKESPDNFGRYIVIGTMVMFFIQFWVNIGMNLGLFPVIGLPLPLVSYGGSALIIEFFLLGIIFNIHSVTQRVKGYR